MRELETWVGRPDELDLSMGARRAAVCRAVRADAGVMGVLLPRGRLGGCVLCLSCVARDGVAGPSFGPVQLSLEDKEIPSMLNCARLVKVRHWGHLKGLM